MADIVQHSVFGINPRHTPLNLYMFDKDKICLCLIFVICKMGIITTVVTL